MSKNLKWKNKIGNKEQSHLGIKISKIFKFLLSLKSKIYS